LGGFFMFSHSPIDWALLVLYFAVLAVVWLRARHASTRAVDYLVAGRAVTLPAFVATLVASWYGGILGVGEYSYRYGISNWLVFGAPYYVGAFLFAIFFARRARGAALYTVPELLQRNYGRGAAFVGALAVFAFASPSAYVLMLGTLFASMFQLPLVPCVIAAAVFSIFYIQNGGMRSVVFSDQIQFVLMYTGFLLMFGFLVAQHGGLGYLRTHLPQTHFTWNGGNPPAAILVWYFIALSTLIDPGFWQRAYAARDPKTAQRGVLISICFWIVFDFLTTFTGLYARAALPHLAQPVFAFPELARVTLPAGALGLFYLAMIATVMSTIDAYGFFAATTLGRDVMGALSPALPDERATRNTKIALWVSAAFACAVALAEPSVVGIWKLMGSIVTPALLLPVATAITGRGRLGPAATLWAMVLPLVLTLTWAVIGSIGKAPAYPGAIEPIYVGLAVSLLFYVTGWLARVRERRLVPQEIPS
jgi:SSS family solute:Na+ symporter